MAHQPIEIVERDVEPQQVAGLRMKGKYTDIGSGFSALAKKVGRHIRGKPLCLYYDGEYKEDGADFEPCFPVRQQIDVEGISFHNLPSARCVTLVHHGPYESLKESYGRVREYVDRQGYQINLPTREVYLKGPGMIFKGNPKKYQTEIQFPIASASDE